MNGIVYLASWPRSGNTLLRAILWQCFGLESCSMYSEDSMYARNPDWHKLAGAVPLPSRMKDIQEIVDRQGVALLKTHDLPDPDVVNPEWPVIYLVRDGREACVSYWHYLREILELDITLAEVIRGECFFGSWSDHVRAWEAKERPNTLLLRYEDVLYNVNIRYPCVLEYPGKEESRVRITGTQLAAFLGVRFLGGDLQDWRDFHNSDPAFFRSGTNDTWRTEMTGDDLALFYDLHGDMMQEYGYLTAESATKEHAAAC